MTNIFSVEEIFFASFAGLWILTSATANANDIEPENRPNILLIVADDLGYSDIGPYGGEIHTPNLDTLATRGAILTDFNTHVVCTPTRAMLLTGVDNHKTGFGTMAASRAFVPQWRDPPGYEGYLNDRVVTIATLLQQAGYGTYMTGKWDLGGKKNPEHLPDKRGFDRSFVLVDGSADHFDLKSAMAITKKPTYIEDGKPALIPEDFYSSNYYTDKLLEYLDADSGSDKPFFAYLAFTAPHYPLQAPDEAIKKYKGKYDNGYVSVSMKRLERMRNKGIVNKSTEPASRHAVWPKWEELSFEMRALESRRMEIYAAMIEVMDDNIGRIMDYLRKKQELENTFIIFISDNGSEGGNPLDWGWDEWAKENFDLSYAQMGRPNSYVWLGPGWAHVSSTPFKYFKGFTTRGGMNVPAIFSYGDKIGHGAILKSFVSVLDLMPTILEVANVEHPGTNYREREIYALQGKSILEMLLGSEDKVHAEDDVVAWEIFDRRALRQGNWKIVGINKPWGKGSANWALYNLHSDPTEKNDLATKNYQQLIHMIDLWDKYVLNNNVVLLDGFTTPWTNKYTHYKWHPTKSSQSSNTINLRGMNMQ